MPGRRQPLSRPARCSGHGITGGSVVSRVHQALFRRSTSLCRIWFSTVWTFGISGSGGVVAPSATSVHQEYRSRIGRAFGPRDNEFAGMFEAGELDRGGRIEWIVPQGTKKARMAALRAVEDFLKHVKGTSNVGRYASRWVPLRGERYKNAQCCFLSAVCSSGRRTFSRMG